MAGNKIEGSHAVFTDARDYRSIIVPVKTGRQSSVRPRLNRPVKTVWRISTKSIWAVLQPGLIWVGSTMPMAIPRRLQPDSGDSVASGCNPGHPASGFQERPAIELLDSLPNLLLRVHHDRAAPCNGLFERLSRDQKETDTFGARLHRDLVAAVE